MFLCRCVVFGAKFASFNRSVGSADRKKETFQIFVKFVFGKSFGKLQSLSREKSGIFFSLRRCRNNESVHSLSLPLSFSLSQKFSQNSFATTNQDTRRSRSGGNLRISRSVAHRDSHSKGILFRRFLVLWVYCE